MKATVLLRHEIKAVDDYYIASNVSLRNNTFSSFPVFHSDMKKTNKMKSLSFINLNEI